MQSTTVTPAFRPLSLRAHAATRFIARVLTLLTT
jgi:hypothetical protein